MAPPEPLLPTSPAAALTLAAGMLGTRISGVRAALLLPVEREGLAVRFTIGFSSSAQQRVANVRVEPDWLYGGVRYASPPLRQALLLRESVVVPLAGASDSVGGLLVDAPRLSTADVIFARNVADQLSAALQGGAAPAPVASSGGADLSNLMLRLATEVDSTLPLNELLHRINQIIVQGVGCDRSATMLWSHRLQAFIPASDVGTPPDVYMALANRAFRSGNIPFEEELGAGRPAVFDRSTPRADARELLQALGVSAMTILPLNGRGRPVGSLTASWIAPHQISEHELGVLRGVARYAATAIDAAIMFDRANKAAEFRDALSQLSLTINTLEQVDAILSLVCRRCRELFRAEWVFVARRTDAALIVSHADGDGADQLIGHSIGLDDSEALIAQAYRDGQTAASHAAGAAARLPEGFAVESLLAVPMFARQLAFGCLVVADPRPHRFGADLIDEVAMAGIMAATAVENARLMEEIKRSRDALADHSARLEARSTALESRTEELEDLLFAASHDLRAPLINIEGFAHELQTLAGDTIGPGRGREALTFIRQNVSRLGTLTSALTEFADLATTPLQCASIDAAALVRRIGREMAPDFEAHGIALFIGKLPTLVADAARVTQVFRHLLDNAVKYLGEAARREIHVGSTRDPHGFRFFVRDSGPGMSERDAEQAFRLFRRGHQRQVPGTGLGLTLVRHIVEKHGGRAWIESGRGRGTTVWFTLPENAAQELRQQEGERGHDGAAPRAAALMPAATAGSPTDLET